MEANVPAEGLKLASSRGRPREEASFRPCAVTGCIYSEPSKKHQNVLAIPFSFMALALTRCAHPASNLLPLLPHPTPPTTTPSQQLQRPLADTVVLCMGHVRLSYRIMVGNREYRDPVVVCTLERGTGQGLAVFIVEAGDGRRLVAVMEDALFFKEAIDFRAKFDKVVELGVGGSKKEINELYRRAFASRGTSPIALRQLGIGHVKVRVMDGDVQLINGPEIVSKYLGESERNLRSVSILEVVSGAVTEVHKCCRTYFKDTQGAWQQSGAAYDALVIQLLTLMDGLNNLLVVGMTNRRELMNSALLRPGSTVPPSDCKAYFSMDPERSVIGSGKTSYLALLGKFSHVKVDHLHQAFEDASK
ncbi:hypothetical protein EMCRGX_G021827 [Ephydatia muelleri]